MSNLVSALSDSYLVIGAYKSRQTHNATVGEQLGHLTDSPNVLGAVLRAEPKIGVKTMPNIVAVEAIRCYLLVLYQVFFEGE